MKKQSREQTQKAMAEMVEIVKLRMRVNFRTALAKMNANMSEAAAAKGYEMITISTALVSENPTSKTLALLASVAELDIDGILKPIDGTETIAAEETDDTDE